MQEQTAGWFMGFAALAVLIGGCGLLGGARPQPRATAAGEGATAPPRRRGGGSGPAGSASPLFRPAFSSPSRPTSRPTSPRRRCCGSCRWRCSSHLRPRLPRQGSRQAGDARAPPGLGHGAGADDRHRERAALAWAGASSRPVLRQRDAVPWRALPPQARRSPPDRVLRLHVARRGPRRHRLRASRAAAFLARARVPDAPRRGAVLPAGLLRRGRARMGKGGRPGSAGLHDRRRRRRRRGRSVAAGRQHRLRADGDPRRPADGRLAHAAVRSRRRRSRRSSSRSSPPASTARACGRSSASTS